MGLRAGIALAAVLAIHAACSPAPSPESIRLRDPPTAVEPSLSPAERDIVEAIRLRGLLGLRNDEAYVRELASDPDAAPSRMYGFPMTPDEDRLVEQRAADMDAVSEVVRKYGAEHQDEWAGLYLETPTGLVVAQFTGSLDVHRAELGKLLHPNARLEIRQARWTSAALKELKDRVRADESWFDTIETRLNSLGVDVSGNRLKIGIRTNREDVIPLIAAQFGGPDRVDVVFEGGIWMDGGGDLVIVARDPTGRPVPNLDCWIEGDDPDSDAGDGIAFATDNDGTCRFRNTAADTVTIFVRGIAGEPRQWRGTARATVRRDDRTTVEVTVVRDPE
jgi:hypothetical protein